jgi:hypothetical protein
MASSESVKNLFKQQIVKHLKSVQLDKALHTWCTEMRAEGKPMTVPIISEKVTSFLDKMKITNNYTFSEGWL